MSNSKGVVYFISGELLGKISPFLLLPFLTRYLGVEEFGELSIYQAYITIIMVVVGMSQDKFILTTFYRDKGGVGLFSAVVLYVLLSVSLLVLLALIIESKGLLIVSLSAGAQTLFFSTMIYLQCLNRYFLYFVACILQGVGGVVLTVFVFEYVGVGVFERLWLVVLVNLLCAFFIIIMIYSKSSVGLFKDLGIYLKQLMVFGGGLLLYQISVVTKGQLDRLLVAEFFDKESMGLYALSVQLSTALVVVLMAVNKVLIPVYYNYIQQGRMTNNKMKRYFIISLIIVPIPALAVYIMPAAILPFIFGDEYIGVTEITVRILLGVGLMVPYMFLLNTLLYFKKNTYISLVSILSAVVYILLFYFLSGFGLLAAAYSLFLANVFIVFLFWRAVTSFSLFEKGGV